MYVIEVDDSHLTKRNIGYALHPPLGDDLRGIIVGVVDALAWFVIWVSTVPRRSWSRRWRGRRPAVRRVDPWSVMRNHLMTMKGEREIIYYYYYYYKLSVHIINKQKAFTSYIAVYPCVLWMGAVVLSPSMGGGATVQPGLWPVACHIVLPDGARTSAVVSAKVVIWFTVLEAELFTDDLSSERMEGLNYFIAAKMWVFNMSPYSTKPCKPNWLAIHIYMPMVLRGLITNITNIPS